MSTTVSATAMASARRKAWIAEVGVCVLLAFIGISAYANWGATMITEVARGETPKWRM